MKISQEQVRHVAKLARLKLSDSEVEKFSGQLSNVFEYMDVLNEVDTSDIPETSQVTGLENVSEVDVASVAFCGVSGEDLLKCSKLSVESSQILVKAAVKK